GTDPTHSLHDRSELGPGRAVEPKAELGAAARIVDRASAADERLARRAAKIHASASGQPLLRHRDPVPSRRCGHRGDQDGRPAAENYQVVLTAGSVCPVRRVALLNRLLVVNVHREKFDVRHRVSSLGYLIWLSIARFAAA